MYDDLVKRLREHNGWALNETLDQAADAIEELMRRCEQFQYMPPPAWIPVTERLPERGQNVIVANKRGKQWDIDKAWLSCLGSGFDRCGKRSLYHVTHWMPLPEPPKEV